MHETNEIYKVIKAILLNKKGEFFIFNLFLLFFSFLKLNKNIK